jgi:NADPH:quinone reductase-like Zn-dependent oxidoreductase
VKAAGINPGEAFIRTGALAEVFPSTFPSGPGAKVLAELAGLIADGQLEVPIANVYPLAQVREAYTELERRHTRGKIVLKP